MLTKADIQLIRSLSDRRARQESGLFVVEGMKLAAELAASGMRIRRIFATEACSLPGIACERVAPREMERISHLKTPSPVLALVELPRRDLDPATLSGCLSLALDGVQDPGNLGTIIRLADWFGIRDIVCSENSADCFNPKVVQATMGAISRVRVHYTNLEEALKGVRGPVYGTFLEGENIHSAALSADGIIVMGSEGRGVSPGVERLITRKLFIPPWPADAATSESLNVATATAIICSEFRRPR